MGYSSKAVAARRRQGEATFAAFCELVAEDKALPDIQRELGIGRTYAYRLMKRLREEMGE